MTYAEPNPGFEDDLTMDILVAELEWVDADDGTSVLEIASEVLILEIKEQGDLGDKFPWRLCVDVKEDYKAICDHSFLPGEWAERNCVDLEHAYHLAEAVEREAYRRALG